MAATRGEGTPPPPEGGAAGSASARLDGVARVRAALRPVLLVVALSFVLVAGWDLSRRWDASRVQLRWGWLALSLAPIAVATLAQAWAWVLLLEHMAGRRVPRRPAIALYLDSQMARYTPGKVGLPLVRISGAPLLGVPGTVVASSIAVEQFSWIAVGGTLGFATLGAAGPGEGPVALLGRGAVPLGALCVAATLALSFVDRSRWPAFVRRLAGEGGTGPLLPLTVPLVHLLHWTAWGAHGVCLCLGFGTSWVAASAGFGPLVLAPLAGFLALVAPAGAGVREAVLSVGLSPTVGAASALVAAVVARVASLVADVSTWIVARSLLARERR